MSSEQDLDDIDLEEAFAEPPDQNEPDSVRARLVTLEAENEQLRREYSRARRTQYRRTALGLILVGIVGIGGGVLFPESREVLFALGGTGIFAGLLTFYLTPEQFIPAAVGERVYAALAGNEAALVADLGLTDARVYLPNPAEGQEDVRLFVPQQEDYKMPTAADAGSIIIVTDDDRRHGLLLEPTGENLFAEFERAMSGSLGEHPAVVMEQVTDALVEQFELVDNIRRDVDAASGQATLGIAGGVYGPVDQFDHPSVSLPAVGLARQLDQPIEVQVDAGDQSRDEKLVTYHWEAPTTMDMEDGTSPENASGQTADDTDTERDSEQEG